MQLLEFHLFAQLPPEIREQIWRCTVEPRIVHIRCWVGNRPVEDMPYGAYGEIWEKALVEYRRDAENFASVRTRLPVLHARAPDKPAILDVCREARSLALYEKIILTPGSSVSYAWVNYDVDVIHLVTPDETFARLVHCGNRVRRLQIPIDQDDKSWYRNRLYALKIYFPQLEECFFIMAGRTNIWHWRDVHYNDLFACPVDKINLIDERSNQRMTYAELSQMSDEDAREWIERDLDLHLYVDIDECLSPAQPFGPRLLRGFMAQPYPTPIL
ncbi:hypothetical protein NLG97_g3553 [Lecanicillium saksenae]|uniref:Uncharacterized protein n=1 Tax=Lecanicillium saksenae TaxID=468837 RepID=A0ACC1QXR4_9HYPO|nr:hypothetical protein NLG97_g3553 [Lecanicillium saksenae]